MTLSFQRAGTLVIMMAIQCIAGGHVLHAQCTLPSGNTLLILQDAGGRKDTITFGHHPLATHGRDTSFCEHELPPPPPSGIFDFRFTNPPGYEGQQPPLGMGQGFYFDFRPQVSLTQIDTHRVRFQPGPGGYPVTLTWSISSLLAICDSAILKDEITGTLFTARMHTVSSLAVTNPAINSLLLIKYGAAAIPAAPSLVSPVDGAINQSTSPALDWNNVTGASSYHVQVSTDSLFTSIVLNDSTVVVSNRSVTGLLAGTTYFWRVNAKNGAGTGAWSVVRDFTTLAVPAVPVLSSPADGAIDQSTSILLQWQTASGATTYRVQASIDSLFSSTIFNDSTIAITSASIGSLSPGTQFFWRVNAKNVAGTSGWSSVWDFTTLPPPAAPVLLSPSDGTTGLQTTQQLNWQSVAGALSYRAQVSTDSLFVSTVYNDSTLAATSTPVGSLAASTQYFWRVRAKNTAGSGAWSAVWDFTTVAPVTNQYGVNGGWNMLSLPLTVSDPSPTTQFPSATSAAFSFTSTGYAPQDTLENGTGYWLKFGGAENVDITGVPRFDDTLSVMAGWNLIGSTTNAVDTASVIQIPGGIKLSDYFGFTGGYTAVDSLQPSKAYWVKMSSAGQLVLPYNGPQPQARSASPRTSR